VRGGRALKKMLIRKIVKLIPAPVRGSLSRLVRAGQEAAPPPLDALPGVPDLFGEYRILAEHPDLQRKPGGWVYKGGFYPDYLTVGGASHAIFPKALKSCSGRGVDIGAGFWPLPGACAVDIWRGPGAGKTISDFDDASLDYVFSSHCLEHIEDWREALAEWVRKLRLGGIIFVYLPHPDCAIWHPGSPFVGNGHKWSPTPGIIKQNLEELGCEVEDFDDGPDSMQSFYVRARKRSN
jgi:SAM-dependent methyltransferase